MKKNYILISIVIFSFILLCSTSLYSKNIVNKSEIRVKENLNLFSRTLPYLLWQSDGVAICNASGNQQNHQICSDGDGGAIIIWQDYRNGDWDIFAQRINSSGHIIWKINGTPICRANNTQINPKICSDDQGGVIIMWEDWRNGSTCNIYIQRINSTGNTLWQENGTKICSDDISRLEPALCYDGTGGAIIVWLDDRNGNYDIFAQRVNSTGHINWTSNGESICNITEDQLFPGISYDGDFGAIISWADGRNNTITGYDIYVQRINSNGNLLWNNYGVPICTYNNNQNQPRNIHDGNGGAIITWVDYRGVYTQNYVQKVNSSGNIMWTVNGSSIGSLITPNTNFAFVSDKNGGAFFTWERFDGSNKDIYAQWINSNGIAQWTFGGIGICVNGHSNLPDICSDGIDGIIIAWYDDLQSKIYGQWILANGKNQWTKNGVILSTSNSAQSIPKVCNNQNGSVIIAFQDIRGADKDIYSQQTINITYFSGSKNFFIVSFILIWNIREATLSGERGISIIILLFSCIITFVITIIWYNKTKKPQKRKRKANKHIKASKEKIREIQRKLKQEK